MRLRAELHRARLRAPFRTSHGSTLEVQRVLVTLSAPDGAEGRGEVTTLPWYDGVSAEQVIAALSTWRQGDPLPALPQAAAALDLALWDLRGRCAGAPVWRLLGGEVAPEVLVNATIAAESPAVAAAQARQASAAGFTCIKLKAGTPQDAERVAAVRAAAPEITLRLDANGAWSEQEAPGRLAQLEQWRIELCEEPVSGLAANARVARKSPVPVALDESARLPGALERRHAAAVCLKVAGCGGLSGVVEAARQARRAGYRIYLASSFDGPLGIAAALHAATAVGPDYACGLATLSLFDEPDPLPARQGWMRAPGGAGLGV